MGDQQEPEGEWSRQNYLAIRTMIETDRMDRLSICSEDALEKKDVVRATQRIKTGVQYLETTDESDRLMKTDVKNFFIKVLEAIQIVGNKELKIKLFDLLYNNVYKYDLKFGTPTTESSASSHPASPHPDELLAMEQVESAWNRVMKYFMSQGPAKELVRRNLAQFLGKSMSDDVKYGCIQFDIKAKTKSELKDLADRLFANSFALYTISETIFQCADEYLVEALDSEGSSKEMKDNRELILELVKILKRFTDFIQKADLGGLLDGKTAKVEFLLASECQHTDIKMDETDLAQTLQMKLQKDTTPPPQFINLIELGSRTKLTDLLKKQAEEDLKSSQLAPSTWADKGRGPTEMDLTLSADPGKLHAEKSEQKQQRSSYPVRPKSLMLMSEIFCPAPCLTVQVDDNSTMYHGGIRYTSLELQGVEKQVTLSMRLDGNLIYILSCQNNRRMVNVCDIEKYVEVVSKQKRYQPEKEFEVDEGAFLMAIHKELIVISGVENDTTDSLDSSHGYVTVYHKENSAELKQRIVLPFLKAPRCMCINGDRCFLIDGATNSLITIQISTATYPLSAVSTNMYLPKGVVTPTSMVFHKGYLYLLCKRSIYILKSDGRLINSLRTETPSRLDMVRDMSINDSGIVAVASELAGCSTVQKFQLEYIVKSGNVLDLNTTDEEIEDWFKETPPLAKFIVLAATTNAWLSDVEGDVSRLGLTRRGFSAKEILKLLKTPVGGPDGTSSSSESVMDVVIKHKVSLVFDLLDQIESDDHLHHVTEIFDAKVGPMDSDELKANKLAVSHYLLKRLAKSEHLLDWNASATQIDKWFSLVLKEPFPTAVAMAIKNWLTALGGVLGDVSKLRLTERDLSQQQIMDLLKTPTGSGYSELIMHLLVTHNEIETLIGLLKQIKSPDDLLALTKFVDANSGANLFGRAFERNKLDLVRYLFGQLNADELYNMMTARSWLGRTSLHWMVFWKHPLHEVISKFQSDTQIHHLLSLRDSHGQTVLSYSIFRDWKEGFDSILARYSDRNSWLLELAAITDNSGNTSFHYAAGQKTETFLVNLLQATCTLDTREKLANVLSVRDISGDKKRLGEGGLDAHSNNPLIYDWAVDSITNHKYLMFEQPSILVMYSTVDREGADEEATSLIKCFEDLGLKVQHSDSFTENQLFKEIDVSQETSASKNGQIVVLMGLGMQGYIIDSDGTHISLEKIEERMCRGPYCDTPKLMIIQCSQRSDRFADTYIARSKFSGYRQPPSYCPRHADFCALMSTSPGSLSQRNTFIPFFADAIRDSYFDADIGTLMVGVKRRFPVSVSDQAPGCLDLMKFHYCLKSMLPVYLNIDRKATFSEKTTG